MYKKRKAMRLMHTEMKRFILLIAALACQALAQPRIIGGSVARVQQFPYAAAIYALKDEGHFFYGGAIISNQWILTVGQCVDNAVSFNVLLGSIHLSEADDNRLQLSTSEYVLHPEFNAETFENDVGLIKLRMPIVFTEYIQVTYLPTIEVPDASPVVAIGWGQTSDDTTAPVEQLHFVDLSTLSNDECKLVYGSQIKESMMCVEGNYNEGACIGDSGSPLVRYISSRYTVIVGVFSFMSQAGCESTDPSGYARIFPHINWIRNVTDVA